MLNRSSIVGKCIEILSLCQLLQARSQFQKSTRFSKLCRILLRKPLRECRRKKMQDYYRISEFLNNL